MDQQPFMKSLPVQKFFHLIEIKGALSQIKERGDQENLYEVLEDVRNAMVRIDEKLSDELQIFLDERKVFYSKYNSGEYNLEYYTEKSESNFQQALLWSKLYQLAIDCIHNYSINYTQQSIEEFDINGNELNPESIINKGVQFFNIDFLRRLTSKCDPICKVIGDEIGTGWLLPNNYLITNHHVIPTRAALENATFEFNFEVDPLYSKSRPTKYRSIYNSVFVTSPVAELDFSIVQLEDTDISGNEIPLAKWKFLNLYKGSDFNSGDKVYIIQHPGGDVKQVILTGNYVTKITDNRIKYSANTKGGSSGSPVLNEKMKVIALHHAYDMKSSNQGVRIDKIIAHLKAEKESGSGPCKQILENII